MAPQTLFELTAELRALGGGRVWSLMVSLFGDLAQGKGDCIDGPVLSQIMAELGVKPEAARVALHRLRNDGWIASEKQGRISRHSLTPKGRAESAAASPRIYARPKDLTDGWQLVLIQSADTKHQDSMHEAGFTPLVPRVFVGPAGAPLPKSALAFRGGEAPEWLRAQAAPDALLPDYERLHRVLQTLFANVPNLPQLSALDTAVLRCLVVHNWRRLVLKHPALPAGLMPAQNAISDCHGSVDSLFERYPRPALSALAEASNA